MELNSDTIKKIRGLIVFTVVVVVAGFNYRRLVDVAAGLMHIAWPFILGAAIAFILNVPMRNIERHLTVFGESGRLRRPVSLVVTILLVTGGLFLVIFVVAPQLVKTFLNLQSSILVAVTVGGSMMGIVGMLIFIPLCSVLYALLRDGVNARLGRKGRGAVVCETVCGPVCEEDADQGHQE